MKRIVDKVLCIGGMVIAILTLGSGNFRDYISSHISRRIDPPITCTYTTQKPKLGDNPRTFINRYRGKTKVPTSRLIDILNNENPQIRSDEGIIYPTKTYSVPTNCSYRYG